MTLLHRAPRAATALAPNPPELPEAARPQWPPWHAPAALFGAFAAIMVASIPLGPVILAYGISEAVAGLALLALLLVQDGFLLLAALLLAASKRVPRPWHWTCFVGCTRGEQSDRCAAGFRSMTRAAGVSPRPAR